ncbi:MAG TPA: J domain-containing protein [Opitutaceae bacterium]
MNPYLVLDVPPDADDARIRRAYLEAVKEATPETHPVRFKAIVAAYEKIKDEPSRYRYELFDMEPPGESPLDVFLRHARLTAQTAPPSFEVLKEFLRNSAKT